MSLYNSKKEQKLYCYSHCLFDREMEKNGWLPDGGFPNSGVAIISICSPNDDDSEHWFLNDMNPDRILNIDFDDVSPEMWWDSNSHMDYYDMSYLALSDGRIEESRKLFNHHYTSKFTNNEIYLHALDYVDAERIVSFIDNNIDCDFYIHCSAGVSRSQGIVRYIIEGYPDRNWKINEDNPCVCPNIHVVRMLKRVKYYSQISIP